MDVSELADESEQNVDSLLPLIEACRMLNLVAVEDGEIKLTKEGDRMDMSNFTDILAKRLAMVEPFKSSIAILSARGDEISTEDLARALMEKGIMLHGDFRMGSVLLKSMMLKWAVRTGIASYDEVSDSWKLK